MMFLFVKLHLYYISLHIKQHRNVFTMNANDTKTQSNNTFTTN